MGIPQKLTYNTAFQILGRAATVISTIAITFLITRNFSVGDYGSYTAILSYVALFFVFSDFGFNAIFVREVGSSKEKQLIYLKNLLGLRFVVSIAVAFVAIALLAFTDHSALVKLGIIFGLGILVAQSFTISALAIFQAKVRYDQAMIADIFGAIANLIFVFIGVALFQNILFVIIALVLGNFVRALVALYLAKFQVGSLAFAFDRDFWRKFALAALPIGLITVFSQFNAHIDKQVVLLVTYKPALGISGETAAGVYGLAYKVFELAIIFPAYVLNVGYPIMVRKKEDSIASFLEFAKKLSAIMIILGIAGLILGLVFAPIIVGILGGKEFADSILTARILFLGLPLFFITPLTLWLAVILKKTKEMLFIYGFAAVFNLVANLIFVPNFGYNAAAIVTLASESLILILSIFVLTLNLKKEKS